MKEGQYDDFEHYPNGMHVEDENRKNMNDTLTASRNNWRGVPVNVDSNDSGAIDNSEQRTINDTEIMFHFGGRGDEELLGNYSWGCQAICGNGYINPDGNYITGQAYTGNNIQKWNVKVHGQRYQGAYEAFADTWRTKDEFTRVRNNKQDRSIIRYTLLNEHDILEKDRYYIYYRIYLKMVK